MANRENARVIKTEDGIFDDALAATLENTRLENSATFIALQYAHVPDYNRTRKQALPFTTPSPFI